MENSVPCQDGNVPDKVRRRGDIVVIFDFDDTLFPTSVFTRLVSQVGHDTLRESDTWAEMMRTVDSASADVLSGFQELIASSDNPDRPIYVVSNASQSWINDALSDWMPKTRNIMSTRFCQCVSARDRYASYAPNNTVYWKVRSFESILPDHDPLRPSANGRHVISIGDGDAEWEAADLTFGKDVKRIRMQPTPSVPDLIRQLRAIHQITVSPDVRDTVLFLKDADT